MVGHGSRHDRIKNTSPPPREKKKIKKKRKKKKKCFFARMRKTGNSADPI